MICHALHHVAIVRHHDQSARPGIEQILHSNEHIDVHVIARLVEDKNVGRIEQDEHELHPALLSTRKGFHLGVEIRLLES